MTPAALDGRMVAARAFGWDGSDTDDTDWALFRSDLPILTSLIGTLTVERVDDLDYTQFVVNGIPVDPETIREVVLDGIVASAPAEPAVCPNCHGQIAQFGFETVPRDGGGKWCTGAGCYLSPAEHDAMTPGVKSWHTKKLAKGKAQHVADEQAKYDAMTPGQKAAYTKAKNKKAGTPPPPPAQPKPTFGQQRAAATKAAKEAAAATALLTADEQAKAKIDKGEPLSDIDIDNMSVDALGDYLSASGKPHGPSEFERRVLARNLASQHRLDHASLLTLGYPDGGLQGNPRDARRAVLREWGDRRPTGGPNTNKEHVNYTAQEINGMDRAKIEAIVTHHSGGDVSAKTMAGQSTTDLAALAIDFNDKYQTNVNVLMNDKGYDSSIIPHSLISTNRMLSTNVGLTGYVLPPGPKPKATPATPMVSGKPSNWTLLSPGQKAAWTKNKNAGISQANPVPHPAHWQSMTAGEKAAWAKTNKIKSVTTTSVLPGATTTINGLHTTHIIANPNTALLNHLAANGVPNDYHAFQQRLDDFNATVSYTDRGAVSYYTGSGHSSINAYLRTGIDHGTGMQANVDKIDSAIATAGSPAPTQLLRGKAGGHGSGEFKQLSYNVGDEFPSPTFGSWTTSHIYAESFANTSGSSYDSAQSVIMRLVDSHGTRSIPGNSGEAETIMPRGITYRVLGIVDFISPVGHHPSRFHRFMDVEVVVPKPKAVTSSAGLSICPDCLGLRRAGFGFETVSRDAEGKWCSGAGCAAGANPHEVGGVEFHASIAAARTETLGPFLSLYDPDEYEAMRTFLDHDGRTGGALKDHGDGRVEIVSLFNNGGPRGAGSEMLDELIAAGGNYLEAYGPHLPALYARHGFVVESTTPFNDEYASDDWNYTRDGRPDYVTMRHP